MTDRQRAESAVADEAMWSRVRTKVLTKTSAHDPTADYTQLQPIDTSGHVDDRKHVTSDVKMALIDKCSCGSPRLRRGEGVTSLNRKLDVPGHKSTKNEYTKTAIDNRKKTASSTNTGHARKEEANNAKNAACQSHQRRQLPSNGVTSSDNKPIRDSDDDSDVDMTNRKSRNRKWGQDETGSSSNYTALNHDVNYVRVSPPKMTRRLKPQTETEIKMTREAQLAASRAASWREAGTQPTETVPDNNVKTPPVKPRTILPGQGDQDAAKNTTGRATRARTGLKVDVQAARQAGTSGKEMKPASAESDYIALSDLQSSLAQSQLTGKSQVDKQSTVKTDAVAVAEAEECRSVSAEMFEDGENSFLKFTFTVKLDNKTVTHTARTTDTKDTPVVSGTVNIVKSTQPELEATPGGRKDTTISVKPVVSVQGGVVIGQDKPETRASSAGSRLTSKPIGIAGIQLTHADNRREITPETGSTQRSTQLVSKRVIA